MSSLTVLVLLSKLPVYLYVIHKAYRLRHSLVVISANWLGALSFMGAISAISLQTFDKVTTGIIAYGVVFCLFMLAFTAKELKSKE